MLMLSRNIFLFIHIGSLVGHILRPIDYSDIPDPGDHICSLQPPQVNLNGVPTSSILCPNGNYSMKMVARKDRMHLNETHRKLKIVVIHLLIRGIIELFSLAAQGKFKWLWSIEDDEEEEKGGRKLSWDNMNYDEWVKKREKEDAIDRNLETLEDEDEDEGDKEELPSTISEQTNLLNELLESVDEKEPLVTDF